MMTYFRRLSTSLIFYLSAILAADSQTVGITGVTVDLNGQTMYYTKEINGKSLFYRAEKNEAGVWTGDEPLNSLNSHIEGYLVKSPFISYDGTMMYFSSNIPGSEGFDIYCSRKAGDEWQKPVKVPVVNSSDDETNPSLSADNMSMYFTRQSLGREFMCHTIYRTERDASANWIYPMPMPLPVGLACENTPRISPDGRRLFFVSDRVSEKKRRKFNVCYSTMIHDELWSPPMLVDSVNKEYNEYHPSIDYASGELHVVRSEIGKDRPLSELYASKLPLQLTEREFILVEGRVKDREGKSISAKISLRDAYSSELVAVHENDEATGKYRIVPSKGKRYIVEVSNEKSASIFWNLNTMSDEDNQYIQKDFTLFDKLRLELEIYDDFTGKALDASLNFYPQGSKPPIEQLGKGHYICHMPLNRQIDVEVSKASYTSENISIKIPYQQQFAELKQVIRLKPGLRRGELRVEDVITNKTMTAEVRVKNLDAADEAVTVEPTAAGGYSFNLRKSNSYSLNVMKKGYMYFHAIWAPDASGVRRSLNIRLVPLQQTDKIAMQALKFNADTTEFAIESLSEIECIVAVIRNNPGVAAKISIPDDGSKASEKTAHKVIRIINSCLASRMIPQSRYSITSEPKTSQDNSAITPMIQFSF